MSRKRKRERKEGIDVEQGKEVVPRKENEKSMGLLSEK
jgi:hypothetical protein